MIVIKSDKSHKLFPASSTVIREYQIDESDISGAVAEINGRYPESGYAKNLESKELVYVLSGSGTIITKDKKIPFTTGDVILINKQDEYFWEGNFKIFMVNSPKFDPKQHKIIK
jgi:mannose-6-phosphate isomerase class I